MNEGSIKGIMRRTYRYFYQDGLVEIAVGALFLIVGLGLLTFDLAQDNPTLAIVSAVVLPALVIGGSFMLRRLVAALKERITYPRTGYVSYQNRPSKGRWLIVVAALVLALVGSRLPSRWADSLAFILGELLAIILAYLGARIQLKRLYFVAALAAVIGIAAPLAGPSDIINATITFAGVGLALGISGGQALIRYLRKNRLPVGDAR